MGHPGDVRGRRHSGMRTPHTWGAGPAAGWLPSTPSAVPAASFLQVFTLMGDTGSLFRSWSDRLRQATGGVSPGAFKPRLCPKRLCPWRSGPWGEPYSPAGPPLRLGPTATGSPKEDEADADSEQYGDTSSHKGRLNDHCSGPRFPYRKKGLE